MSTFNPKQSYVGIDLGSSAIKVVQMGDDNGRPRLMTYGYIEQHFDVIKNDTPNAIAAATNALKQILKEAHVTTKQAVGVLPSFAIFSSIISLPLMTPKELNAAVRWEAKKFVPMPIEELSLNWNLLKEKPSPNQPANAAPKNLRVLITAAPKTLVDRFRQIFLGAGLQIAAIDTEAFALERSLLGIDPAPVMIVDIGSIATDIAILVDGVPLINRSIDVGGDTITSSIAQGLNIDIERAEQFKRDFGLATNDSAAVQVPKTIEFVLSSILNEIRFVLNLYRSQNQQPVEKIVLSGGSAFLLNLPAYLEKNLQMKTFIGDPWARTVYPLDLKPVLQEIGPRFAVSIGLAMREIVG
jgi:type IV pilus assembly protein PilM